MAISSKVGWRPNEFAEAVGLCRASVYILMRERRIESVKNDLGKHGARIITTSPAAYLDSLKADTEAGDL